MPIKALDKKKPVLRVMPLERPMSVRGDVYTETHQALFNAYNMIESMINKNMGSVIANIKPENINDILKLSNAMSSLGRTAIELERWQYQKDGMMKDAIDHVENHLTNTIATDRPDLLDEIVKILNQHRAQCDPVVVEAHISSRLHLSASLQQAEEDDE